MVVDDLMRAMKFASHKWDVEEQELSVEDDLEKLKVLKNLQQKVENWMESGAPQLASVETVRNTLNMLRGPMRRGCIFLSNDSEVRIQRNSLLFHFGRGLCTFF